MTALAMFRENFAGRILPLESDAAMVYAEIFAAHRCNQPAGSRCRLHPRSRPAHVSGFTIRVLFRRAPYRFTVLP